jgi:hypothetical protein
LRNVTSQLSNANRVELANHDPQDISTGVKERTATVASLDRSCHLDNTATLAASGQAAYIAYRDI